MATRRTAPMSPTTTTPATAPRRAEPKGGAAGHGGAARIDPRISARRTAVTREQGRRRLRVLVVGLGRHGAARRRLVPPAHPAVLGPGHHGRRRHTTRRRPRSIAAGRPGRPPAAARRQRRRGGRRASSSCPGCARATVSVHWPDGVHIVGAPRRRRGSSWRPPGGTWADARRRRPGARPSTAARPTGLLPFAGPAAARRRPGSMLGAKDARRARGGVDPAPVVRGAGDGGHGRARRVGPARP